MVAVMAVHNALASGVKKEDNQQAIQVNGVAGIVVAVLQHLCWQGDIIRFFSITKQSMVMMENQSAQDQQCRGEGIASVVVAL